MIRNQRRTPQRGGRPRAVRFAAAITEEEDLTMRRQRPGLGRVFFVVLLMHFIAIGGILAFNYLGKEEDAPLALENAVAEEAAVNADPEDRRGSTLPPRQTGKPILVDHPDPEFRAKGYKRYRVGLDEQLPHIAREFNASAAKLEQINGFRSGERLYTGQWITVVDKRGVAPEESQTASTEDAPKATPLVATPIDPTATQVPTPAENEPRSFDAVVENRPVHERLTAIDQPASTATAGASSFGARSA